ncbi:hypothetical protein GY45DRAFT_1375041 [Cubamyces sp. BRFM 1775]|nr:hypothetical protein GY45DRAFT_1375041 [Cubamyces sp. BRFM 1775]
MSNEGGYRHAVPTETIHDILDLLTDDRATRCSCAATSRAFLSRAREHLYRDIVLEGHAIERVTSLNDALDSNSALAPLVKTLSLSRFAAVTFHHETRGSPVVLVPDLLPFHRLTCLRALILEEIYLHRPDDLVRIVGQLPQLERLVCDKLIVRSVDAFRPPDEMAVTARPQSMPASFPTLKEFVVRHGTWDHAVVAESFMRDYQGSVESLESVEISFGGTADALPWAPILRAAGVRLRTVVMSMADHSPTHEGAHAASASSHLFALPPEFPNYHTYLLDNLAHCRSLQSILLKHHPHYTSIFALQSLSFLEALCATLERRPSPFPALEHLELWSIDRDGCTVSVSPELSARLARSLLDRETYPAFRRLTVRVLSQFWVYDPDLWPRADTGKRVNALKDGLVRRWREAFNAFEEAPAVTLEVFLRG